jgi:hypothetical protein
MPLLRLDLFNLDLDKLAIVVPKFPSLLYECGPNVAAVLH